MAGVLLDQAGGHIHAEAVAAETQPEGHDVLHEQAGRLRLRGIGGELPVFGYGAETVVQAGLRGEAVDGGAFGTFGDAA